MKFKFLHIVFIFLCIYGTWTINSCKPKKQEIPPYVNITLEVKDEKQQPVPEATAYVYESQAVYDKAYQNSLSGIYDGAGSIMTGYVVDGQLVFSQVPSNKEYWILIHDDSRTFIDQGVSTGIKIHRDNSQANYYIDKFQNGTEVFANIKLEAVNALIKIVAPSVTTPFKVMDVGNKYENAPVTLSEYVQVRKGSVPYMVRTDICIWTGAVEAAGGVLTTETLNPCDQAGIAFSYKGTFANDSILIYLGQNRSKPVAVIKASRPTQTIYVGTQPNFTYFAEMINGKKCVWESSISPSGGSVLNVPLGACE